MYNDKKAAGRPDPNSNPASFAKSGGPTATASNQERTQSNDAVKRDVGSAPSGKYNEGNLIRVADNNKGTGRVGVPTAVSLSGKDFSFGAVENPDGKPNRPGNK